MECAYAFAVIALVALPQAIHDTFAAGFQPMPLVTWLSQSFLQLVLLAVIMKGQALLSTASDAQAKEQHDAVLEILQDVRDDHADRHEALLQRIDAITPDASTSIADQRGS
jgi:hypothetical protein